MAVVNEYNQGYLESARRLYQIELSTFDGHGFPDKAYEDRDHVYETLGVAWCVYAGALLGTPDKRLVDVLLIQQGEHGGFHTHYRADAPRLADPNVETTSVALLALHTVQNGAPLRLGFESGDEIKEERAMRVGCALRAIGVQHQVSQQRLLAGLVKAGERPAVQGNAEAAQEVNVSAIVSRDFFGVTWN